MKKINFLVSKINKITIIKYFNGNLKTYYVKKKGN